MRLIQEHEQLPGSMGQAYLLRRIKLAAASRYKRPSFWAWLRGLFS